ncbi:MAG: DMT family transporter [Pirellulaceae bacterium]|nr:DMT family transporter [Planctomycetales bacterium]
MTSRETTCSSATDETHSNSHVIWGSLVGGLGAVVYTAANTCLRSATHCDPMWVCFWKSLPVAVLTAVPFMWHVRGECRRAVSRSDWSLLMGVTVLSLWGNFMFQIALGVIGLALAVPVTLGSVIVSGAVLGRFLLGESLTRQIMLALAVLITAIFVLSFGADDASRSLVAEQNTGPRSLVKVVLTLVGLFTAGFSFCSVGAAIRVTANHGVPIVFGIFVNGVVLSIAFALIAAYRIGLDGMLRTPSIDLAVMASAGVFNAMGFWLVTTAIRMCGLIHVNAINASQSAMAATAGVIFFAEPVTSHLLFGVLLTILGLAIMKQPRQGHPQTLDRALAEPAVEHS